MRPYFLDLQQFIKLVQVDGRPLKITELHVVPNIGASGPIGRPPTGFIELVDQERRGIFQHGRRLHAEISNVHASPPDVPFRPHHFGSVFADGAVLIAPRLVDAGNREDGR